MTLRCIVLLSLLLTACSGGSGGETITPEDLAAVFVRRSVCQDTQLGAALARIVGASDGAPAAGTPEVDCARSTDTCEAFLACSGIEPEMGCSATDSPRCEGTSLVRCTGRGRVQREQCDGDPDGNMVCLVDELGVARCAVDACTGSELVCDGDAISFCGNGVRYRRDDCAASERFCVSNGTAAACVDSVEPCERDACEGDVLRRCVSSGLGVQETDCAARVGGGTCSTVDGEAQCVAPMMTCVEGSAECAEDVLRHCVGGRWIELDCGEFLGATCVEDSSMGDPTYACVSDSWP